jgi:hypothetical protein
MKTNMLETLILTKKTALATTTAVASYGVSPEIGLTVLVSYALGVATTIIAIKLRAYVKR